MSWLYSRVLVVESLGQRRAGYASSVRSNQAGSADAYWYNDKTSELCQLSRYGMTCEHLTAQPGEDVLMWCQGDSHAKPSAAHQEGEG